MPSFYITRPHAKKRGHVTGEWLPGNVDTAEAAEEAEALLSDPRDTISGVYLWSDRHSCFVNKWRR